MICISARLREFRRDQAGVLSVADYMLLVMIVTIGSIVGISTVRDSVAQEFGDVAVALETLQQTYTVSMTFADGSTRTYGYIDDTPLTDPAGQAPAGIDLSITASGE